MKPKIVVFTTPNADMNVLFNMRTQFRHDDHKFEWSRQQFEEWYVFIENARLQTLQNALLSGR